MHPNIREQIWPLKLPLYSWTQCMPYWHSCICATKVVKMSLSVRFQLYLPPSGFWSDDLESLSEPPYNHKVHEVIVPKTYSGHHCVLLNIILSHLVISGTLKLPVPLLFAFRGICHNWSKVNGDWRICVSMSMRHETPGCKLHL